MTAEDRDRLARAYLLAHTVLGDRDVTDLVWQYGPALTAELVAARTGAVWQDAAGALVERCTTEGLRLVGPGDEEWPAALGKDPWTAPLGLWVRGRGRLDALASRAVGVAGRIASSPYGQGIAADLGRELAQAGWTVVTLGRYGIDSGSLRGALLPPPVGPTDTAPSEPFVLGAPALVLPLGRLTRPSPPYNRWLFDRVRIDGVLAAEHGTNDPDPDRRPDRRQVDLLVALTAAVVLVEPDGWAFDTGVIRAANDAGRLVLAYPGPAGSRESEYAHALIRAGHARLVTSPAQVLAELEGSCR